MTDIPYLSHYEPPYSITWTGNWPAGTHVTVAWTSAVQDAPCGSYYLGVDLSTSGGDTIAETHFDGAAHSVALTLAHDATAIHFNAFADGYCTGGTVYGVRITPDGTPAYCVYGTQMKPDVPNIVNLIPAAITAIVGAFTDGWGWPLAAAFAGYQLDVQALCAALPPTAPNLTPDDLLAMLAYPPTPTSIAALEKGWQWLRSAAWNYF